MPPIISRIVLTAFLTVSFATQAQTPQGAPALSPTAMLVQSMGFAAEFKAQVQRMQALPNHAEKIAPRLLALEKKMFNLSEVELGGAIARALDTSLSASDSALIAEHYNSSLGKKLARLTEQAQAAAAKDKTASFTVHLANLLQTLSPDERRGLDTFAATGATDRLVKLLDSGSFNQALLRELEALPVAAR